MKAHIRGCHRKSFRSKVELIPKFASPENEKRKKKWNHPGKNVVYDDVWTYLLFGICWGMKISLGTYMPIHVNWGNIDVCAHILRYINTYYHILTYIKKKRVKIWYMMMYEHISWLVYVDVWKHLSVHMCGYM